jgi:2-polyprenyl-3-methyl-5-hydroxy-6-metoxy-1,4-benzoquinol methylase
MEKKIQYFNLKNIIMEKKCASCIICNNSNLKIDTVANGILGLNDEFNVYKCENCKQRSLVPQLSEQELDWLYSSAYFDNNVGLKYPKFKGITKAPQDYKDVISTRLNKFRFTIKNLQSINPSGKTILDVGAASGDFVKLANDFNLISEGIEYSQFAIDQAKNLNKVHIEKLILSEVKKKNYYDFIHLNHVFEHFNDPNTECKYIYSLLKNDGVLYLEIPFQFHIVERIIYKFFKQKTNFSLSSVHHPFFYNPDTILKMLQENNFKILKLSVYDYRRYNKQTIIGFFKNIGWFILSLFKIGNYIELYAVKN